MKKIPIMAVLLSYSCLVSAQSGFRDRFKSFDSEIKDRYESFREQCNREYAEYLKKEWEVFRGGEPVSLPDEKMVPPLTFSIDGEDEDSDFSMLFRQSDALNEEENAELNLQMFNELWEKADKKLKKWRDAAAKQIYTFKDMVLGPIFEPQPHPIEEISEVPVQDTARFEFTYCGTVFSVRAGEPLMFSLASTGNSALSSAWTKFKGAPYDNVLFDCLKIREDNLLCDWAYLQMIDAFTSQFYGSGAEATLLSVYLMTQSGYQVRLARANGQLFMLFACYNEIFDKPQYRISGDNPFFVLNGEPGVLECPGNFKFPGEQPVSLNLVQEPFFDESNVENRVLQAKRSSMSVTCGINLNLLEFFESYPASRYNSDDLTRWTIYANTPLDEKIRQKLYPELKARIDGKTELAAVDILLKFVQDAFPYGYDDEIWGHDRAFFAEETLHYPSSDCEDHAILFSRLVRDLVGLDVVLVYYPGHLATAVKFNESVNGDYLRTESGDFIVCDPTCRFAPVGVTAPSMDNRQAQVIALHR